MNKMSKTKIEWCDYTLNPVKGLCPMACDYCYARRLYKRFKWNPDIRFEPSVFDSCFDLKAPSRIFVGSTIELLGSWVKPEWLQEILDNCLGYSWHTYIFLTKRPQELHKWSFPSNCHVGITATTSAKLGEAYHYAPTYSASVKFVSIEPMLEPMTNIKLKLSRFDWVIIGAATQSKYLPPAAWMVQEVTDTAKELGIPVFHKDNLGNIFDADGFPKRQELPK